MGSLETIKAVRRRVYVAGKILLRDGELLSNVSVMVASMLTGWNDRKGAYTPSGCRGPDAASTSPAFRVACVSPLPNQQVAQPRTVPEPLRFCAFVSSGKTPAQPAQTITGWQVRKCPSGATLSASRSLSMAFSSGCLYCWTCDFWTCAWATAGRA